MIKTADGFVQNKWCLLLTAIGIGIAGIYVLSLSQPEAAVVAPAKVLHSIEVKSITAPVKVYADKAKKKLVLPKAIQENSAKVVLTATDLPKTKYEQTVTAVLDTDTGDTVQYVQTKPLPLFAKDNTGSIGAYYGFKNSESALRIQATQDLFTVKAMTFGAVASVDVTQAGRTDTFVGIGARLDW